MVTKGSSFRWKLSKQHGFPIRSHSFVIPLILPLKFIYPMQPLKHILLSLIRLPYFYLRDSTWVSGHPCRGPGIARTCRSCCTAQIGGWHCTVCAPRATACLDRIWLNSSTSRDPNCWWKLQNRRIVEVRRDLWTPSSPNPCSKQGRLGSIFSSPWKKLPGHVWESPGIWKY